jgi:exopolysaccharide biosynthesis protein
MYNLITFLAYLSIISSCKSLPVENSLNKSETEEKSVITYEKITNSLGNNKVQYAHILRIKNPQGLEIVIRPEDDFQKKGLISPTKYSKDEKLDVVINANFYQENGNPIGYVVSNGRMWTNFVLHGSKYAGVFSCDVKNKCHINYENNVDVESHKVNLISGYPMLISNGQKVSPRNEDRHPRTAIGLDKRTNDIVVIVTDGRAVDIKSGFKTVEGYTYDELSDLFISQGVDSALNLDGGGSSQLIYKGKRMNMRRATDPRRKPDQIFHERKVPVLFGLK